MALYFGDQSVSLTSVSIGGTDANFAPPNGAAYFRVSARGSGANLIVTLDEEIT